MKILFIGGTGVLSSACSELALKKGMELYHLNRGTSSAIRNIQGVKTLIADIREPEQVKKVIADHTFDVVVDFIAYEPQHIFTDLELFSNITRQYVFISSASCYEAPKKLPVTEDTTLDNPYWEYSRKKIACEEILKQEAARKNLIYTIIRPSHTYDKTKIPAIGGYTALHRMLKGEPVILPGDGTSVWTLTHNTDFAVGLVGLLGNAAAHNEIFHITSDEWLSWNRIYEILATELGVKPNIIHVPSKIVAGYDTELGANLLGDKSHSMIFDNSKIQQAVPDFKPQVSLQQGIKDVISWYKENTANMPVDNHINQLMDRIAADFSKFFQHL